jgi:hypothetical protein
MAMAITIPNAYVETFESNIRHLAQQGDTLLRKHVTELYKQSEKHNWDRLAESTAREKTAARMVSPAGGNGSAAVGSVDGLAYTRRNTSIRVFDTGEVVESEDITQMLIDPRSSVAANLAMNMKRKIDDVIISAVNDPAADGAGGTVALPAGQSIGGAAVIISLDTILEAQEIFATGDVDPDEDKVLVIGPKQQRKLMQLLEVTSGDFQNSKALATGYLPNFLGFDIVVSNRLGNTTTPPAAGTIYNLAFCKSALGLHIAKDITAKVGERADMSFATQFYCEQHLDAVRVEDEKVVQIHLKDALV